MSLLEQYIQKTVINRKTGEVLSVELIPHPEQPTISEDEAINRYIRAMGGSDDLGKASRNIIEAAENFRQQPTAKAS